MVARFERVRKTSPKAVNFIFTCREDIILPFLSMKKIFTRDEYHFVRAPDGTPLPWVKMKRTCGA